MKGSTDMGGVYKPLEINQMNAAINAVCHELGIGSADRMRRERVAGNVISAWSRGGRMPLDLVRAGLEADSRELA